MTQLKILIIEDEPGICRLMQSVLEPAYTVHVANDGEQGLQQARWVKPDLILLDLRLPKMDGLSVLAKLKADRETNAIPVVIVSARGETDALIDGQRAGAVDHLIKPFEVTDLRHVVQRQLSVRGD